MTTCHTAQHLAATETWSGGRNRSPKDVLLPPPKTDETGKSVSYCNQFSFTFPAHKFQEHA